ncbi:hypothetical protein EYR40_005719 [Pleurotus pulmonarius]|nr:hypothetical protein EYR40_005719 [Pleurotus pulmonarius]
MRQLEEYKNTRLLIVSKLPPEVLSIILEVLALSKPPLLYDSYSRAHYRNILPATQVCRLWRQVALDSPRVWSYIYSSAPPRLVELFLERARSAPLCLRSNGWARNENILTLLDRLHQVKELNLKCNSEWWKRITSESTPLLETLALENASGPRPASTVTFSTDAFPALRHLALKHYICASNPTSFIPLHSLAIDCTQVMKGELPNPIDFFSALNDLPHLSSLTLTNALAQPTGPPPSLSINLPSLTDLSIADDDIRNIGLMACITAPRIETITLCCNAEQEMEPERSAAIVADIYLKLPDLTHTQCQFVLAIGTHPYARVRAWTKRPENNQDSIPPLFDFKVPGTSDLRLEESVLTLFPPTTVPPILNFSSNATTFSDDDYTVPRQRILRQLMDVTEVHANRLMDLALIMCDTPTKRGQTTMSLPSWKTMVFHDSFYSIKYKSRILGRLKKQLKARKTVNAPIETWQLDSMSLSATDLEQFQDLVDCVSQKPHGLSSWRY